MDHTPECDEQSEVLFVFTEDAADNQPPPATSPPATSPPPAASPAPPHRDSADQSFWSEVYTLDPPHALHIHRFFSYISTLPLIQLSQKPQLPISHSLTPYRNPSSVSLPSTTATCNEHNTTHALPSTPLTPWLAFHQRPTLLTPTSSHQTNSTSTPRQLHHPATSHHSDDNPTTDRLQQRRCHSACCHTDNFTMDVRSGHTHNSPKLPSITTDHPTTRYSQPTRPD